MIHFTPITRFRVCRLQPFALMGEGVYKIDSSVGSACDGDVQWSGTGSIAFGFVLLESSSGFEGGVGYEICGVHDCGRVGGESHRCRRIVGQSKTADHTRRGTWL